MRFVLRLLGAFLGLVVLALALPARRGSLRRRAHRHHRRWTVSERRNLSGPEPDWAFARDVREIQFQLVDPPRSTDDLDPRARRQGLYPRPHGLELGTVLGSTGRSRPNATGGRSCASGARSTRVSSCASRTDRCWSRCWSSSLGSISGEARAHRSRSRPARSGSSSLPRGIEATNIPAGIRVAPTAQPLTSRARPADALPRGRVPMAAAFLLLPLYLDSHGHTRALEDPQHRHQRPHRFGQDHADRADPVLHRSASTRSTR